MEPLVLITGLALVAVTLLLRWPLFATAVYPISLWLVNLENRGRILALLVGVVPLAVLAAFHNSLTGYGLLCLLPLIFAGPPFPDTLPAGPAEQAERVARVIRRYFVPLPLLAALGLWGLAVLWLLRFGWFPGRNRMRRWLNLRTGQLVGIHLMIWRQMRPLTDWLLSPPGQSAGSLYQWSTELVRRSASEYRFGDLWRTLALIRWQWVGATVLLQWWLG